MQIDHLYISKFYQFVLVLTSVDCLSEFSVTHHLLSSRSAAKNIDLDSVLFTRKCNL